MSGDEATVRHILFGVGYQGREVAGLIDALRAAGVTTVVDVRLNPVSRRPGFSKGPLSKALAGAGIAYIHERSLGNPKEHRAALAGADPEPVRRLLLNRLATDGGAAMDRLLSAAKRGRVAVLCLERSRAECHRSVILERAQALDPGLELGDIP